MARLRLFRTPRHKTFEYEPRHYNPDKEELNARIERITAEVKNASKNTPSVNYNNKHRADRMRRGFSARGANNNSNRAFTGIVRLYIMVTLLAAGVAFFYYGGVVFSVVLAGGILAAVLKLKARKPQ